MSKKIEADVREFTEEDEKPVLGLVNGGHTILECSSCGKGLVDIFHTQPKAIDPATGKPFSWKVKAICCYCGDHSYIKEIKGKFYISGYAKNIDDDQSETQPDTIDTTGDLIIIKTMKAK